MPPGISPAGIPSDEPLSSAIAETGVASLSPEARRNYAQYGQDHDEVAGVYQRVRPQRRSIRVLRRVWMGVINDGTIHAGNFAYMVLISLFPFFVTGAALFSLVGRASGREAALGAVLSAFPPDVASVLDPIARKALAARTGSLLWLGGAVGLWTVGSLVETIRDVLRRAYGTRVSRAYWQRRLISTGLIIASVVMILLSITAQVALGSTQEALLALAPHLDGWIMTLALSRYAITPLLYGSLWVLFVTLCPEAYWGARYPKWPGALFVTVWWQAITLLLPKLMRSVFTYDLTYGSMAGVMIALFFFWLVGLGIVVGAELNAALAETPEERDLLGPDRPV